MRRAGAVGVVLVVLAGGLAACSGQEQEPLPSFTGTPVETPTSTPTPEPTEPVDEIGVVMDLSDPEIGFELVDVPTDLEGDEADVYNTLALYGREYWRGLRDSELSPFIDIVAAPDLGARLQEITDENVSEGHWFDGTFATTISKVAVDGDSATALICDDYRAADFVDAEGTYTADEVGFPPTVSLKAELLAGREPGQWIVTRTRAHGAC